MEYISREKLLSNSGDKFHEILTAEAHHDHKIRSNQSGVSWEPNDMVKGFVCGRVKDEDIARLLTYMGYDKNSEVYRKLYRDCGYSLMQYWDIFYNPDNNPKASEYNPNTK